MTSLYSPPSRIQTFFIARIPTCKRMADELCRVTLLAFFHRENKQGAPPKNHLPAAYIVPWQLNYHSKPRLFRLVKKILRFRSKGRWIVGELGKRGSWAPVQVDELLQLILNKSLGGFEKYLFGRMSFDFFFLFPSVKRPRPRCQKFILSISLVIKVMENFVGFDKIADLFEFYLVIVEKELYKRDEVIEQTVYFITRNVRLLRND